MNTKKILLVFIMVFPLLMSPLVYSQQNVVRVEFTEVKRDSTVERPESSLVKQFPQPKPDEIDVPMDSLNLEYSRIIFESATDFFPIANSPSIRLADISIVHYILAGIDLYYATNDSYYLNKAESVINSLNLEINGSFIRGKVFGVNYEFNAADNFLLILAYERLARAFEKNNDFVNAQTYWNIARNDFTDLINLFYFTPGNMINSTLLVSDTNFVTGGFPYASAKATGLFSIANFLSNNSSIVYSLTKNTIDSYRSVGNVSLTLPDASTGYLYNNTLYSLTYTDLEADLQGNIYFNTALLQHSRYQEDIGDATSSQEYYDWAAMGELAMKHFFKSSTTQMLHSKYTFADGSISDLALTYENCLFLAHRTEFMRRRIEMTGLPPSFNEFNDRISILMSSVFLKPDYFLAGLNTYGDVVDLIWENDFQNPLIIHYQAVSTLANLYPIRTKMYISNPEFIILNVNNSVSWYFELTETSSIFRCSNQRFSYNLEFILQTNTLYYLYPPNNFRVNTSAIDGSLIRDNNVLSFNFTPIVGGEKRIDVEIYFGDYLLIKSVVYFNVNHQIRISTEPTNLRLTQITDKELILSVYLTDETQNTIDFAQVIVTSDLGFAEAQETSFGGLATFYIPIETLVDFSVPPPSNGQDENFLNSTITIAAVKDEYNLEFIEKTVIVTRNSIIVELSPQPLEVKEGSDFSLYIDVTTSIPANIYNPKATIEINGEILKFDNEEQFNLPNTVNIEWSYLKNQIDNVTLILTIESPSLSIHTFDFIISVIPLQTLERIYQWIETALQSDIVKIVGSLGIIWALLWKQFSLRILHRIRRCPYCGDYTRTKFAYCKNCGLKDESKKYKKAVDEKKKEFRVIPRLLRKDTQSSQPEPKTEIQTQARPVVEPTPEPEETFVPPPDSSEKDDFQYQPKSDDNDYQY